MTFVIVGSGMMGSALAFPARKNGLPVRLAGTPPYRGIIAACRATGRHPKFKTDFPALSVARGLLDTPDGKPVDIPWEKFAFARG